MVFTVLRFFVFAVCKLLPLFLPVAVDSAYCCRFAVFFMFNVAICSVVLAWPTESEFCLLVGFYSLYFSLCQYSFFSKNLASVCINLVLNEFLRGLPRKRLPASVASKLYCKKKKQTNKINLFR